MALPPLAYLLDPLRATIIAAVLRLAVPAPLAGSFTGLAAERVSAVMLVMAVAVIRGKQVPARATLAATGRNVHKPSIGGEEDPHTLHPVARRQEEQTIEEARRDCAGRAEEKPTKKINLSIARSLNYYFAVHSARRARDRP
jgi:hypothetical protein